MRLVFFFALSVVVVFENRNSVRDNDKRVRASMLKAAQLFSSLYSFSSCIVTHTHNHLVAPFAQKISIVKRSVIRFNFSFPISIGTNEMHALFFQREKNSDSPLLT